MRWWQGWEVDINKATQLPIKENNLTSKSDVHDRDLRKFWKFRR